MSSPKVSISVPKSEEVRWDNNLPLFLESVGMKGAKAKLSTVVWKLVIRSRVFTQHELVEFAAKENMKTSGKKYIVLAL